MKPRIALIAAAALLAGCSANRHCVGDFPYQRAATLAEPAPVEGLSMPESVSALRIPPPPEQAVPYAREMPDPDDPGATRISCLDVPPPMTVTPDSEAPEAGPTENGTEP